MPFPSDRHESGPPAADRAARRRARSDAADRWVRELAGPLPAGVALLAVGGLGRRELTVLSDLDLLLVHAPDARGAAQEVAGGLWAAIWDAGVAVDHSTRTPEEALAVAGQDLAVALGLIDARLLAGSAELAEQLHTQFLTAWRRSAGRRLPELQAACRDRAARSGELAFLGEPDLRDSRGGLRDGQALRAAAASWLVDAPGEPQLAAYRQLLDVRGTAHGLLAARGVRRREERLRFTEQDLVADLLGFADADALLAATAGAGRTLARALDRCWARVADAAPRSAVLSWRRRAPARRPLADGVICQGGQVVLARDSDPAADPVLALRAAAAAAGAGLPLSAHTLERLTTAPALPVPWPEEARQQFLRLLGSGPDLVGVVEDLDDCGYLQALLPEWAAVRNRPQRNPLHAFTVDRHLLETVAAAAPLVRQTRRPDLLLLSALLHDIGKGRPGDHSEVGAALAAAVGTRIGLPATDVDVLARLVGQHLLLADTAVRRDLDDPVTVAAAAAAVGTVEVLDVLHPLTIADGQATGPAAWSGWKAELVDRLAGAVGRHLGGDPPVPRPALSAGQRAALRELRAGPVGSVAVRSDPAAGVVTIAGPDVDGLFAACAGVLALHGLDVRSVSAGGEAGLAADEFLVTPRLGGTGPDLVRLREELRGVLAGTFPLAERLAARAQAYRGGAPASAQEGTAAFAVAAAAGSAVLEVRAPDRIGLLHELAAALLGCRVTVRSAFCSTLGHDALDVFYLEPLEEAARAQVLRALRPVLAPPAPPAPAAP